MPACRHLVSFVACLSALCVLRGENAFIFLTTCSGSEVNTKPFAFKRNMQSLVGRALSAFLVTVLPVLRWAVPTLQKLVYMVVREQACKQQEAERFFMNKLIILLLFFMLSSVAQAKTPLDNLFAVPDIARHTAPDFVSENLRGGNTNN